MNSRDKDKLRGFAQQLKVLASEIETYIACANSKWFIKWNAGTEQYNECRYDERTGQLAAA